MQTLEEQERAAYMQGDIRTADLLGQLEDITRAHDELEEKAGDLLPVRYFIIDYENEDGPELLEVSRYEWEREDGTITYERHTMHENGCNQICLTKGLDA